MTQKIHQKYIFIDTSVFLDAVISISGKAILEELTKKLTQQAIVLILPEVIKVEILNKYQAINKELIEKAQNNLSTNKILGIDDNVKKDKKTNKRKDEIQLETIDNIITKDRNKLLTGIKKYYKAILEDIKEIFNHKNTKLIEVSDNLLLSGMKRSLLKKAPFTSADKTTENAHTKDADCIAYESMIYSIKSQPNKSLIICVSDKDYISEDGTLHKDILNDLKNYKFKSYKSLIDMLNREFNIKIESSKNVKKSMESKGKDPSLSAPNTGIDSSLTTVTQTVAGSNL